MDLDIDVVDFLTKLGIKNIRVRGNEVGYSCPFPGHSHGDKNPSADMRADTTQFKCWGCGESGNAVTFLAAVEGVPPHQALAWLEDEYGAGFKEPKDGSARKEVDDLLDKTVAVETPKRQPTESDFWTFGIDWMEARVAYMKEDDENQPLFYMFRRGFQRYELEKFDIGYDPTSRRITIPWHDDLGTLVGFKGRAWHESQKPRYLVIGGEDYSFDPFEVSAHVYNLHRAVTSPTYLETGHLNVTEGELNAIAMSAKGWENTVGFSGRWLSARQVGLLKRHAKSVTLISDDQEDAIRNAKMLHHTMQARIAPKHSEDPADLSPSELTWLLGNATSSLYV